jgi:hypothetical protein
MKIKSVPILGITLLFGSMAFAQDDHSVEVTVDYSYVHANPQNYNIIPTFSLNPCSVALTAISTEIFTMPGMDLVVSSLASPRATMRLIFSSAEASTSRSLKRSPSGQRSLNTC